MANNFPEQITTPKTLEAYQKRCDQLVFLYAKGAGVEILEVEPLGFVKWLIAKKTSLKAATFRQYKASVTYGLSGSRISPKGLGEALARLEAEPQTGCLKQSTKTSSTKAKLYPPETLDRVIDELNKMSKRAKYAKPLLAFLFSSIAVGLRPSEWAFAECVQDTETGKKAIIVKNAKGTNNRGSGEMRTILYAHMPANIQSSIEFLVDYASQCEDWDIEQKKIADLHHRIIKRINPKGKKRSTLYSCRHQCSANMKANGYTKEDVATVMGHGSSRTATLHYGRGVSGRKSISKHVDCAIEDMLPNPSGQAEKPSHKYTPKPTK